MAPSSPRREPQCSCAQSTNGVATEVQDRHRPEASEVTIQICYNLMQSYQYCLL